MLCEDATKPMDKARQAPSVPRHSRNDDGDEDHVDVEDEEDKDEPDEDEEEYDGDEKNKTRDDLAPQAAPVGAHIRIFSTSQMARKHG